MTKKMIAKRVLMAGLCLLLLLGLSGCLQKPDTIDANPSPTPPELLPFPTVTASPSPSPVPPPEEGTNLDETGDQGGGIVGTLPTQSSTVTSPLVTVTPSPTPTWTFSPAPTATPTADGTLRSGSNGQAVRDLQQRLKDLGYYTGSVDGDFGSGTESAVREFQRVNGLSVDGVVGSRTLSTINSSSAKSKPKATAAPTRTANSAYATARPTPKSYTPSTPGKYRFLQLGSSGTDVSNLQQRLKDLGYYKGSVNGRFEESTEAAVLAFQERNGQWVDGVAGQDTQEALFSSTALAAPAGSKAVPSSGYRALASGEKSDDVTALQERLKELGYYTAKVDGQFGQSTIDAVTTFQATNGLAVSGTADTATQARLSSSLALYAPVTEAQVAPVAAVSTADELQEGSTGEGVYRLQERLYDLGYYTGRIDGVYGESVSQSVRGFQKANSLTANGKANTSTLKKLYGDSATPAKDADDTYATLQQGDEGERVRALQSLLNTYGYYQGNINGSYGADTQAAVAALQRRNGLSPDGVAGPATQQLLYDGSPLYAEAAALLEEGQTTTLTTNTYATQSLGMESPDVMVMQEFLYELGYYDGAQDGVFSAETMLAVQAFQEQNGLEPTGVASHETLALLFSGTAGLAVDISAPPVETPDRDIMREGDEGQDVFTMQERLVVLGYLGVEPDGKYGTATTAAVKAFQSSNGLSSDGVAGLKTVEAMYATGVKPAIVVQEAVQAYTEVDNRNRELYEQEATGAIQVNLAGGGIAAGHGSNVYYVGSGGNLYRGTSSGKEYKVYEGDAAYIHASDRGVTFVSGNKILRVSNSGGKAETLVSASGLSKLSVVGDTLYYQAGDKLYRKSQQMDPVVIADGIKDFTVDVYQHVAYTAGSDGIYSVGLNGNAPQRLVSSPVDQVQLVDSVVFYRSGGSIYRMQDGVSMLVLNGNATWMGVYRSKLYYVSGNVLFRSDTDGKNTEVFYDGKVAEVSFVSGKAYIAEKKGGAVKEILPVE